MPFKVIPVDACLIGDRVTDGKGYMANRWYLWGMWQQLSQRWRLQCGGSSANVPQPGGQGKHIRFKCKVAVSAVCALCTIHAQNAVPQDCTLAF